MSRLDKSAAPPDLRIIEMKQLHPHEEHDSQRSKPLLAILREAEFLTNPPIVAPMPNGDFVVMDGANRFHCFQTLGYEHLLVQLVPYESEQLKLGVWQHIVSAWSEREFSDTLFATAELKIKQGWDSAAIAQILLRDGAVLGIHPIENSLQARARALSKIVEIYQSHARLDRTALHDPSLIFPLYPDAIALVLFPAFQPDDVIAAAQAKAYLPPGITRHMVQGRALNVNYPLAWLSDSSKSLAEKNEHLQEWIRQKIAGRKVRYYAESTYQFDEY